MTAWFPSLLRPLFSPPCALSDKRSMGGFTLIELLIVVAIIGILAAIAVPNFLNAQMKARIARVEADQQSLTTALELYFLDWNSYVEDHDYPSDRSQKGLFRLTSPISYIGSLPLDPFPTAARGPSENNPHYEFGSGSTTPGEQWPAQAYVMASPGPDLDEEMGGNDGFPFGTYLWRYSPTNGLYSTGDIVRMGGNYNVGFIFIDGKPIN